MSYLCDLFYVMIFVFFIINHIVSLNRHTCLFVFVHFSEYVQLLVSE